MAAKSTSAPATPKTRTRRKSVSKPQAIKLTAEQIRAHARELAHKEYCAFLDNVTEAEMNVIGHLIVGAYGGYAGLLKEIRRLLG